MEDLSSVMSRFELTAAVVLLVVGNRNAGEIVDSCYRPRERNFVWGFRC
ncbi:hypothetical protein LINPERPRIM_LOCUS31341 [Linum perenne]